ncbi:MAG: SiaB family protein kinase, partial [Bacteroidales bacterium]|nr:SiaB family protein kinase [Bacteroidales bacterium]
MPIIKEEYQQNCLLTYQGPITVNLVSFLGNYIKSFIEYDTKVLVRLFKIYIELTQNVSYYSSEKQQVKNGVNCGVGWFTIQESDDSFRITTGNRILKSDGKKLTQYCNEINQLNEEELRDLKRKTRAQAMVRDVGAHIGLIQTSLTSGSQLDFKIDPVDRLHSFFT